MTGGTADRIAAAMAALGDGPLTPAGIDRHVRPLFSRVLRESGDRVYLANHSLGRPLDAMAADIEEGMALWYARLGDAWEAWRAEIDAYRARLAQLLGAPRPDAVIPKSSAGQGLRAVLNTYQTKARVVATRGEFDSIDVILREYARRQRIDLELIAAGSDGRFTAEAIGAALDREVDLVVLSPVMFASAQVLPDVRTLIAKAHAQGAKVVLDVYHMLGVMPDDVAALDADFAIGGSYKYLRGGPGACFLYVHPRHLDAGLRTLDIGWFAKQDVFAYLRPDPPRYAPGGDGWMESTPAVLPFYQARAGQLFTLAVGVARQRTYSLEQQRQLIALLADHGVRAHGGHPLHGAFVTVRTADAQRWVERLDGLGIAVDARGEWLRICPDVLTTHDELLRTANAMGALEPSG